MKRELLPSDVGTAPLNKKNGIVSLPPTPPPLIADVKVQDVFAKTANGNGVDLSSIRRNWYEQLHNFVNSLCMEYAVPFQWATEDCGAVRQAY